MRGAIPAETLFEVCGIDVPRVERRAGNRDRAGEQTQRSHQLEIGKAAEHLVCADLLLAGYSAFLTDQGHPYDVVVDLGPRLIRIQVKATSGPKNPDPRTRRSSGYFFHLRRAGRGAKRLYAPGSFDLFALVALDIRAVAYIGQHDITKKTIALRVPGIQYLQSGSLDRLIRDATFERALLTLDRQKLA